MILVTTSDYYPQIGGLTTFAGNIVKILEDMKLDYELYHWKNINEIQSYNWGNLEKYNIVINIHPMFCWLSPCGQNKMINFIHGSEILMTSPNLFKRIFKVLMRSKYFKNMQNSRLNIFISKATQNKIKAAGFQLDVSRDIVFHNCIDLKNSNKILKHIKGEIVFSCIVRNVPHKNLAGAIQLCEELQRITERKIKIIVPCASNVRSDVIDVLPLKNESDETRDNAYKEAHFNLLLSKDNSDKGFFEGFGLTVLEAGKYGTPSIVMNTGGLPEAVHHESTGFVINGNDADDAKILNDLINNFDYLEMQTRVYDHVMNSHGLNNYKDLFNKILKQVDLL